MTSKSCLTKGVAFHTGGLSCREGIVSVNQCKFIQTNCNMNDYEILVERNFYPPSNLFSPVITGLYVSADIGRVTCYPCDRHQGCMATDTKCLLT